ncbi:MAG: Rossmann-like and DUF2520 domain-containing protein [Chitinophagales bacterium]
MKIVLIGSGNVATVLGRKLIHSGHQVGQVFSKQASHAQRLAKELNSLHTAIWEEIDLQADLYIVAISDDVLHDLSRHLKLDKKLVVHTAGSVSKEVLSEVSRNFGVLYPLQSLRKELIPIPPIPLLIDANTIENLTLLHDFAQSISSSVAQADDLMRIKLHLAAVIANNFANHLLALTEDFCLHENLDFRMLLPLIRETVERVEELSPQLKQTGPAVRNDVQTIRKHLDMLKSYPLLESLYYQMTLSIASFAGNNADAFANSGN